MYGLLLLAGCCALAAAGGDGQEHGYAASHGVSWSDLADMDNCDQAAVDCLKDMHTEAGKCVRLSFNKQFQKKCGAKIKHLSARWWRSSSRWHRAAGACINGTDAPSFAQADEVVDEHMAANEALEQAEPDLQFDLREDDDAVPALDKDKGPYRPEAQKCWYQQAINKAKCEATIIEKCRPVAECLGYGPEPADRSRARWYNHIRALRDFTELAALRMQVAIRRRCGY